MCIEGGWVGGEGLVNYLDTQTGRTTIKSFCDLSRRRRVAALGNVPAATGGKVKSSWRIPLLAERVRGFFYHFFTTMDTVTTTSVTVNEDPNENVLQIAEHEDEILQSLAAAAEVDLALARGRLGAKTGGTIPKVRGIAVTAFTVLQRFGVFEVLATRSVL